MRVRLAPALGLLSLLLAACASGGGGGADPAASPDASTTAAGRPAGARPGVDWPVMTREHIDLWLHGYAMVQDDSAQVPYFARGYRDRLVVAKNQARVVTALDRARDSLRARIAQNPGLVGGQFIPLSFATWDDMRRAIDSFLAAQGSLQRARTQQEAFVIQLLAGYFPSRADREWLRSFSAGLEDERAKFYHEYWLRQQRERAPALAAVDSAWQRQYRPKLQRYFNNTQQQSGELILSLPLDGEGRTVSGSERENVMVVAFPARPADAPELVYVVAHEAIAKLAATAISDNTTPSQKREGAGDRFASPAAVLGGLLLVERTLPELADGYARYYLRAAGRPSTGANPRAALQAAFPLQAGIRDDIRRQLDVVLGGI